MKLSILISVNFFTFVIPELIPDLKKILIYFILLLFLFNSMGYYFLFELNKHLARQEIQTLIQRHPKKLMVLTIVNVANDKEFQWIHKKEFRYKGEMYDIVREVKSGQTTVFICLHDVKESKLFAGLKRVNHDKHHCAAWDHHVMIFLTAPFFDLSLLSQNELIFPDLEISLISPMLQPWSPPPEYS